MALSPVPSEQPEASCANCGSALVADQRYCLSCGQPVSPVRLAFLDVLAPSAPVPAGAAPVPWVPPGTIEVAPSGYVAVQSPGGASAWLRRNSGLLGLTGILGLFLLAGLLVGHWVSASKAPASTTVKIEGLGPLAAAPAASTTAPPTASEPAEAHAASKTAAKKEQAKEVAEATRIEKAPPKAPKAVSKATINKLTQSKGKKHQEEIAALGSAPIETG